MRLLGLCLVAVLLTAACSDGDDKQGGGEGQGAAEVAETIAAEIDEVTKTVEITEDNDPNDSIGRPGSYTEAVSIYDSRATCDDGLDITCGAKVEVFTTADAAKERRDLIQSVAEESGGLISEYDYLDGAVLLRVSDQLTPTEAAEYEAAFSG